MRFFVTMMIFVSMRLAQAHNGSFYEYSAVSIDGERISCSDYRGKVVLVVNVASRCGFTGQYEGLQKLYSQHEAEGFVILGFPSNDFGGQEPGSESEIKSFCSKTYGVTFPMFSKVKVLGDSKHPLYEFLTKSTGGQEVSWNFEKFLLDRQGRVIGRFPSSVSPANDELAAAIQAALTGKR